MRTLHLKKLARGAINYLTNIFNLSIATGQIHEIWHKAIIIPIQLVLVALDLTAALNNVDHQLNCAHNTNIPATIRHWLHNYMQNRRAEDHFQQQESKSRKVKTGVVQGGVLSPALFNYYLADIPTPPPNIKLIKYADDITIYTSGPVVADLINGLNIYLSQVLNDINNKN